MRPYLSCIGEYTFVLKQHRKEGYFVKRRVSYKYVAKLFDDTLTPELTFVLICSS